MSGMQSYYLSYYQTGELSMIITALVVESAFYALYAILFVTCVYILCKRRQKSSFLIFLVAAVIMFALSTARIIYIFCTTLSTLNRGPTSSLDESDVDLFFVDLVNISLSDLPVGVMYVTNNVIADGLIVYRCYVVWGFKKSVIILPALLVIATGVCGYIFPLSIAMISMSLVTNILVTTLIAGRIWWIARQTEANLGRKNSRKYNTAIAIIVESGAFYSISFILLIIVALAHSIVHSTQPISAQDVILTAPGTFQLPIPYVVYAAVAQIVGIVPTLIIVRVGLGFGTEDTDTFKSTYLSALEFGRVDPPLSQSLATNTGNFDESDQTLAVAAV